MTRKALTAAVVIMCIRLLGGAQVFAADSPTACSYLSASMDAHSSGPEFLASYPTVKSGPLHAAAFLYDNAAAIVFVVLKLIGLVIHIALIGALVGLILGFAIARAFRRS